MPTDTVRIEDFIAQNGITMRCERTDRNPSMEDSASMDHWKVTLKHKETPRDSGGNIRQWHKGIAARMTLVFSQGYGHKGAEPELASVLDCLASDASGVENARTFEEWCDEYGYDADSRKAEKIYKACMHQASRLKTFLGEDLYEVLLWNTERC